MFLLKLQKWVVLESLTYGFLTWTQLSMVASQCLILVPKPHSSDCRGRFNFWLMNFFTCFFLSFSKLTSYVLKPWIFNEIFCFYILFAYFPPFKAWYLVLLLRNTVIIAWSHRYLALRRTRISFLSIPYIYHNSQKEYL